MKLLTQRALQRFRISLIALFFWLGVNLLSAQNVDLIAPYVHEGKTYDAMKISNYEKGVLVEFTNKDEFCTR